MDDNRANQPQGDGFDILADQIDRDYDEYGLETGRSGPVCQLALRYAF